ncbi:MAG UNVERIFIED_CONTAM: hypothetical protein LVR29_26960 [Microcystis novacekii LVE1205-3]|jgi:hypothetical protein
MNDNSDLYLNHLTHADTVITAEIVEHESQSTDETDWPALSSHLRQQNQELQAEKLATGASSRRTAIAVQPSNIVACKVAIL